MKKTLKLALLVSDSHLWGLWAFQAFKRANFEVEPLLAREIDSSFKEKYIALVVPGGWSKNKLEAMTEAQREIVRDFVKEGGIYLGICGGASLAGEEGLKLCSVSRKKERVPSYSGPCEVTIEKESPLWKGIKRPVFYLWFPPELEVIDTSTQVLARFSKAQDKAYLADLCIADHKDRLSHYEKKYAISLNLQLMKDKPLVIESNFGKGKVLLSLIHYDTPNCPNGLKLLKNLGNYFNLPQREEKHLKDKVLIEGSTRNHWLQRLKTLVSHMQKETTKILHLGFRNFLFHQRYPFFYQWQRGIRGLELQNIYFMLGEIKQNLPKVPNKDIYEKIENLLWEGKNLLEPILTLFQKDFILFRENFSKVRDIELEREIFGPNKKSYGGKYRRFINLLEEVLVYLWRVKEVD
uniref:Biotin-protein ligase N-terminal domain-containing protein n=1 Tax=Caldimicrobium thiodismutans TaxID=1653476 RepID=A0A832GP49_9BACT